MAYLPLVEINGLDCTAMLTTYDVNEYDVASAESGDKQDGDSVYDIVGKDKFQLTLAWTLIDDNYKNAIFAAIANAKDIPVRYTRAGVLDGGGLTYRGDRHYSIAANDGDERLWNLEVNLIGLYVGR